MRTNILDVAEELATRHTVRGFIIPANFGTTARAVLDRFGEGYEYFVVGNPSSSHDKGFVYHSGMSDTTRTERENRARSTEPGSTSPSAPLPAGRTSKTVRLY